MRLKDSEVKGNFGFRGLELVHAGGYKITDTYFFYKSDFKLFYPDGLWPIEYDELNKCVYVPTEEELKEYEEEV